MLGFFKKTFGRSVPVQNNTITTSKELAEVLLGHGLEGVSGVIVTPKVAMGVAAVQCAVRVLSENTGMLPWHLYERYQEEGREKFKKAREHHLWTVLNLAPNSWQSSQEFREFMLAQMCLYRHAYAFKNRANGTIRELIPIHAKRVSFKQNDDLSLSYEIVMKNGQKRPYSQDEILHLRDMSAEGLHGPSRVMECRDVIGLSKQAESYGADFFKNDRTPSGILSSKEDLNPEQITKVRDSWNASEGGKRGGVKVVDNDFQWTSIGTTAEDAQMIETRKFQITEIARIFNIPPHKIGDNERSTFNNVESQELSFQTNSMMPWYKRFEFGVSLQLLDKEERAKYYSKIDNRAMLRGDSKARSDYYQKMRSSEIMSANECRELEDMNPIDGGDEYKNPNINVDERQKEDDDVEAQDDATAEQNRAA